jgi:hypothetical protein
MRLLQFISAIFMLGFISACMYFGKVILVVLILAILVSYGILHNCKLI